MSSPIATLLIELKAKTDQFEKGLKSAKDLSFSSAGEIKSSLGSIADQLERISFKNIEQSQRSLGILGGVAAATGVALATSLIAVAVETSKSMVEMGHSAEKAGMGIKEFTEYAYAAKRSGVPIEEFTGSMSKLAKTALSAAEGSGQAQRALHLAGTSATDANGKLRSTGDILADIVKKYEQTTDRTLKAGLAMQVFGRGGAAMIPFLNQGSKAIEEMRKQADQLGVTLDENTLAKARQFRGEMVQMEAQAKGLAMQFTAGLLPALLQVTESFTGVHNGKSAAREWGETVGNAFRGIAAEVYKLEFALKALKLAWTPEQHASILPTTQQIFDHLETDRLTPEQRTRLVNVRKQYTESQASGDKFGQDVAQQRLDALMSDAGTSRQSIADKLNSPEAQLDEALRNRDAKIAALYAAPKVSSEKDTGKGGGTGGLGKGVGQKNVADDEIAKLREKAQATGALAAAQLVGEQAVRQATAANAADAVILQMATKATREAAAAAVKLGKSFNYRAELEKEVKKYQPGSNDPKKAKQGAEVLGLETTIEANQRAEKFNQTLREQAQDAGISADAHKRMAAAIMQGGSAVTEATLANEREALIRKHGESITLDQAAAVYHLIDAKRAEVAASSAEAFNRETVSLAGAAQATRLLTNVIGMGTDAELESRAAIEVMNYAREHDISLLDKQIMREQILANLREEQKRGALEGLHSEFNPQEAYNQRKKDIDTAVQAGPEHGGITKDQGAIAAAEAMRKLREEQDQLLMRSQTGMGGIHAFFNEYARSAKNTAQQAHDAMAQLFSGMESSMSRGFGDMMKETKSVGQAFAEMGRGILSTIADTVAQFVARWIMGHLVMAAASKVFHVQDVAFATAAQVAKVAATSTSNVAISVSNAAAAAGAAFASVMEALPFPVNMAVAPAMAATALSEGMAFVGMAAFAEGGLIKGAGSGTSDSIPIRASHGEFMFKAASVSAIGADNLIAMNRNPASFAAAMRSPGGGTFKTPAASSTSGQSMGKMLQMPMNVTIHATDAKSFSQMIDSVGGQIGDIALGRVKRHLRSAGSYA